MSSWGGELDAHEACQKLTHQYGALNSFISAVQVLVEDLPKNCEEGIKHSPKPKLKPKAKSVTRNALGVLSGNVPRPSHGGKKAKTLKDTGFIPLHLRGHVQHV